MDDREYGGEEKKEYPSGSSYSDQDGWSGGYGNPYAVSWQSRPRDYGQATYEHPRSHTQPELYGSSYDRSSTSLGYTDFTTDATDNRSSFYQFGPHTQSTYMYSHDPAINTSQAPRYYHHTRVPLEAARPYGVGHHHSAAPVPPATYTDHNAPPPPQQQSAQQSTMSTTSDSSSLTDYAGSFLAHVQKFVARHREAFDLLVEGQRGSEDEIHHNAHSSEMCE